MTVTAINYRMHVYSMLMRECGAEFLKAWRMPQFSLPTIIFPLAFYSLFGIVLGDGGAVRANYFLATYGVFAAMGPALFGFGVAVASERDQGLLEIKRAAPVPFAVFLLAKLVMAMMFALIVTGFLFLAASLGAGVSLGPEKMMLLVSVNLLTTIPFSFLGLALGLRLKAQGAAGITNILFFAMSVFGGLWIPITVFPDIFAKIALFVPSFHLGQLALIVAGVTVKGSAWMHIAATLAFGLLFAFMARRAWRFGDRDR